MREAPRYKPRGRCVCPSSPLPAVWRVCTLCRGGGCGLTHPQAAILTTDLSDAEACVLSASGPGKVSVSFRSEKAVVDQGAIVSSVTVRVSFSGGQTRYNPPVQQQVMISFPFLSHAMQRQSSRILVF